MASIEEVVTAYTTGGDPSALIAALVAREDEIADNLRLIAGQFGLAPEIVAEVITNGVGLGTPATEEEKQFVRNRFIELMTRLREQQEGGGS